MSLAGLSILGRHQQNPCPGLVGPTPEERLFVEVLYHERAAQRLNLSSKKRRRQHAHPDAEPPPFLTNFSEILKLSPPPAPPSLLRSAGRKENFGIGKVKVMLRIKGDPGEFNSSFLNVDARKKQITVHDLSATAPSSPAERRTAGVSAPKMFAFDAIFSPDDSQAEVCSTSLPDVIQAVVGGTDGCLFVYGHSKLGKTHTMVGSSESVQELGVMPCAVSWLFRLIHEQRMKTGARFSVRASALELSGRNEVLRDLLSEYAAGTDGGGTSPGVYLRDDPIFGAQLINQSELRAPTAEKAAFLLDAALAARTRDGDDEGRNAHFLFTLHLYQYRVEKGGKGGVAGGRSRLHLFDLGSCDKITSKPREGGCLSLSALGNVILALFNGQKHVPYKDSKLTQLLKEAMSSLTCRVAMIAHVSSQPSHYSEILGTIQLASRVHRMRKKKIKYNVPMENSDEKGVCVRPYIRMHAEDNIKSGSSDPDYTSSSEQSCDTVIYVPHLSHHKEIDFTDNEGPPSSLPIVPKLKTDSQSQNKNDSSTLDRKRHNSISKSAGDSPRKTEKPSNHTHTEQSGHHQNSLTKTSKTDKMQASSKGSPLLQRHQPASTQTQGDSSGHGSKSAQNSPFHAQKKMKHRTKQDQGTDAEQSPNKGTLGKTPKPPSDETWIDGPRFAKPKFDSKTLHQLQKEQWVDGPPNMYGFMDHHKQSMIERWIEDHSQQLQGATKKKNSEVWIDRPPDGSEKGSTTDMHKLVNESENAGLLNDAKFSTKDKRSGLVDVDKADAVKSSASEDSYELPNEDNDLDDQADSASNSADVDETDNEENAEATGYDADMHILQIGQNEMQCHALPASYNRYQEHYDDHVETIEVMEPDEPVPMVDSCMQVTEEDIMTEYFMQNHLKSTENPLPEVDQSSDGKNHPLRILSEENLNLASSFADSHSVSVDLDSISVPDTCREGVRGTSAVTWHLLYGNMFQRIKEQQQRQRATVDDLTSSNSEINDKLKRIAKLRELIQPLTKVKNQTPVESIFKTCSISRLPSAGSRYTMSEMLCGSTDSSMEDLSQADVTSTQSEPADLDYKTHIKPMNGLKLEEFYKKIQKVPPFLEQYSCVKPTQVVPPLSFNRERSFSVSRMETQRSANVIENGNGFKHSPSTSNINSSETFTPDSSRVPSSLKQTSTKSWLNKNPSSSSLQKELNQNSTESLLHKNQRVSGDMKQELKNKQLDRRESAKTEHNDSSKRSDSKTGSRNLSNKNIDTAQLTVGQSPSISSKSRLYRNKSKVSDIQNVHSQQPLSQSSTSSLWSKDSSITSSPSKLAHRSTAYTNNSMRGPGNKFHMNNGNVPNNKNARALNNAGCKLPARSSPTSSSTSGVTTTCCSTMKQKDKQFSPKNKQSSHKQKQSQESRKSQRTKSICRSTSSPSTCVDSGDTVFTDFTDSEQYHVIRHASISGALQSPYHKIPQVHVSHHHHHHHQRTSSGHGSESSVNSIEPREAKELLLKGTKTQQFSGTSSGYESMLRDSEGTPLSSSQESGNEDSLDRGRRGRRKSPGSSKRSLSAPARSPPSPLGPSQTAISQQPVANSRRRDRSGRRSDEEVCCTGLLCCRLLDFY